MPSKSPAQARLMAAAAHTPGGYGGVPQKVGKEFNAADKKKKPKQVLGTPSRYTRRSGADGAESA